MADDDHAARERLQAGLERAQRVDVEVVGRLVEQQDVAARLEQLGEVDPVPLAARQRADQLLLVRAAEVEATTRTRAPGTSRLPTLMISTPSVISWNTVWSAREASRDWST